MLTLRGSAYSEKDYEALYYAVESARETISSAYCNRDCCLGCVNRHACFDLEELATYLASKISEDGTK